VEFSLTAYYSNGLNSAASHLDACPIPVEPGDTLHGVASAGTFPSLSYLWNELDNRYENPSNPDRLIAYSLIFELFDGAGFPVAYKEEVGEGPADPRGTYVATAFGRDTYNGGSPWSYVVS